VKRVASSTRPPLVGPFGHRAIRVGRLLDIEIGLDVSWLFVLALAATPVAAIMIRRERLATISGDESLWEAVKRMDDLGVNQLPVTPEGRLIRILTREHLLRVLRNQMDLDQGSR